MPAVNDSKYLVQAGWDDVPHLDETTKVELLANTPAYMRDARSKGTPSLGSGAIYPIEQSEFTVDPFPIPSHFARGYGLDVGWNRTAAAFGAWDRDSDVFYINSEHYRGEAAASIHADAIKARGEWLIGAIDPAAEGRSQVDGQSLLQVYRNHKLTLHKADNSVEAGILEVWQLLAGGRLKVFKSCQNWLAEHRLYRRDDKGKVVKKADHLMDATRYLIMSRVNIMRTKPVIHRDTDSFNIADKNTGY